ncbi:hypothetical protein CLHUN_12240 [Ruminiclostridium hungatei]|uniref:Uncharacterized protein n=1 Tax=Ruminiclostridium hungatei TaxID=48256 RepID=A0A1V4SM76_RUMHU|nr:hypothetical protein [Ruminiclostridium hungatei]OPX44992.1 hypothetical protein CLHUN_12240 [Ruminiclostridium hungatei]
MNTYKVKKFFGGKTAIGRCCIAILLLATLLIPSIPVNAAAGDYLTDIVNSPLQQSVRLAEPSPAAPGGRGYTEPLKVCALNSQGRPLINFPVTFEDITKHPYITVVMPGTNQSKITVYTDNNGIASAVSTNPNFIGKGFQIYSSFPGIRQTIQIKASAPGMNSIIFSITVSTYLYPY